MRTYPLIFFTLLCSFFSPPPPASAWVAMHQEFPEGHATVVVHAFCRDTGVREIDGHVESNCAVFHQRAWQARITNALEQWNNAGSSFFFESRLAFPGEDPCDPRRGHIYFVLADHSQPNPCFPDGYFHGGWGTYWANQGYAWVFLNTTAAAHLSPQRQKTSIQSAAQSTFLHELGHAVGLNHTYHEEFFSVMGNKLHRGHYDFLFADDIRGIRALYGTRHNARPVEKVAQLPTVIGALEIPTPASGEASLGVSPNAHQGTRGLVWGWACDAEDVLVSVSSYVDWRRGHDSYEDFFSHANYSALLDLERTDMLSTCGTANAGFSLTFDWGLHHPGPFPQRPDWIPSNTVLHRVEFIVRVYVNGVDMASSNVEVTLNGFEQEPEDEPEKEQSATGPAAPLLGNWFLDSSDIWATVTLTTLIGTGSSQRVEGHVTGSSLPPATDPWWNFVVYGVTSEGKYRYRIYWSEPESWSNGETWVCHAFSFNLANINTMVGNYAWAVPSEGNSCTDKDAWFGGYAFTGIRE